MARKMKPTHPPKGVRDVLVIAVDPLSIARGHRRMKSGGVHRDERKPGRAREKRRWRRDVADGGVRRLGMR